MGGNYTSHFCRKQLPPPACTLGVVLQHLQPCCPQELQPQGRTPEPLPCQQCHWLAGAGTCESHCLGQTAQWLGQRAAAPQSRGPPPSHSLRLALGQSLDAEAPAPGEVLEGRQVSPYPQALGAAALLALASPQAVKASLSPVLENSSTTAAVHMGPPAPRTPE